MAQDTPPATFKAFFDGEIALDSTKNKWQFTKTSKLKNLLAVLDQIEIIRQKAEEAELEWPNDNTNFTFKADELNASLAALVALLPKSDGPITTLEDLDVAFVKYFKSVIEEYRANFISTQDYLANLGNTIQTSSDTVDGSAEDDQTKEHIKKQYHLLYSRVSHLSAELQYQKFSLFKQTLGAELQSHNFNLSHTHLYRRALYQAKTQLEKSEYKLYDSEKTEDDYTNLKKTVKTWRTRLKHVSFNLEHQYSKDYGAYEKHLHNVDLKLDRLEKFETLWYKFATGLRRLAYVLFVGKGDVFDKTEHAKVSRITDDQKDLQAKKKTLLSKVQEQIQNPASGVLPRMLAHIPVGVLKVSPPTVSVSKTPTVAAPLLAAPIVISASPTFKSDSDAGEEEVGAAVLQEMLQKRAMEEEQQKAEQERVEQERVEQQKAEQERVEQERQRAEIERMALEEQKKLEEQKVKQETEAKTRAQEAGNSFENNPYDLKNVGQRISDILNSGTEEDKNKLKHWLNRVLGQPLISQTGSQYSLRFIDSSKKTRETLLAAQDLADYKSILQVDDQVGLTVAEFNTQCVDTISVELQYYSAFQNVIMSVLAIALHTGDCTVEKSMQALASQFSQLNQKDALQRIISCFATIDGIVQPSDPDIIDPLLKITAPKPESLPGAPNPYRHYTP